MLSFFANFIKTGDPNDLGLPEWLAVRPDDNTPPVMVIDVVSKTQNAAFDARYLVLDKVYNKK